jgi:hypothetical protein
MTDTINTDLDIRDINPGDTYYAIADATRGGRCVMNGMFIAAWTDKKSAKVAANGNSDLTVVKCRKPEVGQ